MTILSIIYSIPAVPYPSLYGNTTMSTDSTTSNSPTNSASPSSDSSPHIPQQVHTPYIPEELTSASSNSNLGSDVDQSRDPEGIYILDENVLTGSAISGLPPSQHPYAGQYEIPPLPPQTQPQPRTSMLSARRSRASSNLPPKPPPPASSLPPAPMTDHSPDSSSQNARRLDSQIRAGEPPSHRKTPSGLGALEEETDDTAHLNTHSQEHVSEHQNYVPDTPRNQTQDSPPLPPLPSPTYIPDSSAPPRSLSLSKPSSSPRLMNSVASRPRALSQLPLRSEPNAPHINTTTNQGTIYQRRKTSAPPSTRSASPAESTTSAGSVPQSKHVIPVNNNGMTPGRHRSSSQPGRRPSLVGGRISPDQRPPLPGSSVNGTPRKASIPSKLNPNPSSLQLDALAPQTISFGAAVGFPTNLPTTPTSPLPPIPPSDPLLKPYHMMNLLRNTMVAATGGYVTRRLHVPCEVWSQGGAKLTNQDEKIRVVTILCSALEDLQGSSAEYFGAGNVSSGLALGIGSIGRKEAESWLSKLEDFSNVCDHVVANFGKKLGVGEGFVLRKPTWGGKLFSRFDKFTNGKK